MAADESIIIEIQLDNGNVKRVLSELEVDAEKSSSSIGKSYEENLSASADKVSGTLLNLNKSISGAATSGLAAAFSLLAKSALKSQTSLTSTTVAVGAVSAGLFSAYKTLENFDSGFARLAQRLLFVAGVITGSLALALGLLITTISAAAFVISSKLVVAFQYASDTFVKADKQLLIFSKTIGNYQVITNGASGDTEAWTNTVNNLADSFNISRIELQKAAVEIVGVTSKLGFNEEQMSSLLNIVTQYSKVTGKDLYDTTVAFASALNGQSQGVLSYGVKLGEASNQHFLLKQNIDKTFDSLSDSEKGQVRYNNLLSQFSGIAGVASAVTGSLADQQNRFDTQLERVNISLGKGASIIENNNVLYALAAKGLATLNSTFLTAFGFFGSFGARVLQITSFISLFTFKLYALHKVIQLINLALSSDLAQSAFAKSLPFIGKSVTQVISGLAGTTVEIKSLKDAFLALGPIVRKEGTNFLQLFAAGGSALTFGNIITGTLARIGQGLSILGTALRFVASIFLPFIGYIVLAVGAFLLLKSTFEAIEKRTAVFSQLFSAFLEEVGRAGSVFQPLFTVLAAIKQTFMDFGEGLFGAFVFVISKGAELIINVLSKIAAITGIFSNKFKLALADAENSLKQFNHELQASNYMISQVGDRTVASMGQVNKAISDVNLEELSQLRTALADVGKSDLTKLKETLTERLSLITRAYQQELITQTSFNDLKAKAELDYNLKVRELNKGTTIDFVESWTFAGLQFGFVVESAIDKQKKLVDAAKQAGDMISQAFGNIISQGVQRLVNGLLSGKNAFKNFGKFILSTMGDLAIQVGTLFITTGLAMNALKALDSSGAIAAGIGLVAIGTVLKNMGGTSGATEAVSGNNGAGGTGSDFSPIGDPVTEPKGPQSQIAVTIQGDVLDSNDTGMRIVDIIRSYADKNGGAQFA